MKLWGTWPCDFSLGTLGSVSELGLMSTDQAPEAFPDSLETVPNY